MKTVTHGTPLVKPKSPECTMEASPTVVEGLNVEKREICVMSAWRRRRDAVLQAAVWQMWQEKVGLSWTWGWAGTSQFPWLVSPLCCHRACREKKCLTGLITSLQSYRSWWRVLFSDALSASLISIRVTSHDTTRSNLSISMRSKHDC